MRLKPEHIEALRAIKLKPKERRKRSPMLRELAGNGYIASTGRGNRYNLLPKGEFELCFV